MSTIHDIKTVPETLKNIIIYTGNKKINIIGDKGYVNSSIFLYNNKKINTIVPNRKNMKKRSSHYNKIKLKKRYLIENVFSELKKFNRIKNIKEKNIENFMSSQKQSFWMHPLGVFYIHRVYGKNNIVKKIFFNK
jgi:hypothetical protein